MKFRVTHITEYGYSQPVALCRNEACLLPRETRLQKCLRSELRVDPAAVDFRERSDIFGNRINHFAVQYPHEKLLVTALSEVEVVSDPQLLTALNGMPWEVVQKQLASERNPQIFAALPFLYASPLIQCPEGLAAYARLSFPAGRALGDAVAELMTRIYTDFTYAPGATNVTTALAEVLKTRRGVCQDFAHLGVACLRSLGLAARYVSGYIETLPPPGQERLVGADASHAWFSVFAPTIGWVDFDPTNNQLPAEQHITVAWGRDFSDVSPLKGVALGGGQHKVKVSVDVARIV
jgi:transglutaminase-like putative cysteine protease